MIELRASTIDGDEMDRGVFTTKTIKRDELIHEAPVIPYPNSEHPHIEKTMLADYAFEYGENHSAFLLGYGMMFNHSYTPNAYYRINFERHTFDFYAVRDIEKDEEIFINYNGDIDIDDPLWFDKEEE
ncbi:SET domain-containing protein-lysine N-methyltransferase [Halobacillus fulvus]|nr:SET domain-containing protein-lysine N-methyltransferase [Halobacillus fulvus]